MCTGSGKSCAANRSDLLKHSLEQKQLRWYASYSSPVWGSMPTAPLCCAG